MKRGIDFNNGRIAQNALMSQQGVFSIQKYHLLNQGFLFDLVSNTGLFLALDHRRLKGTGITSPIAALRASDTATFNTTWINEHINTSEITTFVGSGSALNYIWRDQSGNTRNFFGPTPSKCPYLVNTGIAQTVNGKQISVGSSTLQAQIKYDTGGGTFLSGSTMTITVVCQIMDSYSGGRILVASPWSDVNAEYYSGGFTLYQYAANAIRFFYTPGYNADLTGLANGFHVISVKWNGTAVSIRANGGTWNNTNFGAGGTAYSVGRMAMFSNVANSVWGNNAIAACYIYTRVLSDTELSVIERNLGIYYGINVA